MVCSCAISYGNLSSAHTVQSVIERSIRRRLGHFIRERGYRKLNSLILRRQVQAHNALLLAIIITQLQILLFNAATPFLFRGALFIAHFLSGWPESMVKPFIGCMRQIPPHHDLPNTKCSGCHLQSCTCQSSREFSNWGEKVIGIGRQDRSLRRT